MSARRPLWGARGRARRSGTELGAFLSTPAPKPTTPIAELPLLAIDFETTGLDPTADQILSMGWAPVTDGEIQLGGARRRLVSGSEVGQSAIHHRLTDDQLADGCPLDEAVDEALAALRGRVLLAHHCAIETGFLAAAILRRDGVRVRFACLDTMALGRAIIAPGFHDEPAAGALRLWALRERYRLPVYRAHDALTDAIACAELYLAQIAELGAPDYRTLARL